MLLLITAMVAKAEMAQRVVMEEMAVTALLVREEMEEMGEIANMVEEETVAMVATVLPAAEEVGLEERDLGEMEAMEEMDIRDNRGENI